MAGRLAKQITWIGGGASGIGEAIAALFANEGAAVAIIDVAANRGEQMARQIRSRGGRATFHLCDVSQEEQVRAAMDETVAEFGGLHSIVNCAAIVQVKQLHECTEQEWDRVMDVNVKSIFFSLKHGFAYLAKNRRSQVVNVGSISSIIGQADTPAYTASKGAVLQLTRSIALDYAGFGVRCNCLCPGITDTPMLRHQLQQAPESEQVLAERLSRVPLGIVMMSADIAKVALFLCCEESSGITGTSLLVDGGYLAAVECNSSAAKKQE